MLYREAQFALRNVVSRRELEQFLSDKNEIASEAESMLNKRAESFGVNVLTFGIRDVILPGEMKELLNKVTEAKKAAEANLIVRREETAAMRSQANTAKLLENNPTLMRLRELEVLEKFAATGKLQVIIDEKKLTDRVVNLL
jgi:regulator of protease activity HflC (stomatin/prohibitin superfamily)